jgi:hypothetical protein
MRQLAPQRSDFEYRQGAYAILTSMLLRSKKIYMLGCDASNTIRIVRRSFVFSRSITNKTISRFFDLAVGDRCWCMHLPWHTN